MSCEETPTMKKEVSEDIELSQTLRSGRTLCYLFFPRTGVKLIAFEPSNEIESLGSASHSSLALGRGLPSFYRIIASKRTNWSGAVRKFVGFLRETALRFETFKTWPRVPSYFFNVKRESTQEYARRAISFLCR